MCVLKTFVSASRLYTIVYDIVKRTSLKLLVQSKSRSYYNIYRAKVLVLFVNILFRFSGTCLYDEAFANRNVYICCHSLQHLNLAYSSRKHVRAMNTPLNPTFI